MATRSSNDVDLSQRKSRSTVAYPRHPLALCLQVADAVRQQGGNKGSVSKSMLALQLKVAEGSADFVSKITSAKCFNLIEGRSGGFSLTDHSRAYFFPTKGESGRQRAFVMFLKQPPAFAKLIEAFDGEQLPALQFIGHKLVQELGLPEAWGARVANYFVRSAETVGVLDPERYLRYNAKIQSLVSDMLRNGKELQASASEGSPDSEAEDVTGRNDSEQRQGVIIWTYPCEGKTLRIETPERIPKTVWEKLNRYIQILKPEGK